MKVFKIYSDIKFDLQNSKKDLLYIANSQLKPIPEIKRLITIFIPAFFLQTNLYLFFIFRKDFSFAKYLFIICFNIYSFNFFFLITEKKLFLQYISAPNPYRQFMLNEILNNKQRVTPHTLATVAKINKKVLTQYEFKE
jgi:hypothetical protein